MLSNLISIPVMLIFSVLQMTAISRINLLNGSADLILLAIAAWAIREKNNNVYTWALIGGLMISISSAAFSFTRHALYGYRLDSTRCFQKALASANFGINHYYDYGNIVSTFILYFYLADFRCSARIC